MRKRIGLINIIVISSLITACGKTSEKIDEQVKVGTEQKEEETEQESLETEQDSLEVEEKQEQAKQEETCTEVEDKTAKYLEEIDSRFSENGYDLDESDYRELDEAIDFEEIEVVLPNNFTDCDEARIIHLPSCDVMAYTGMWEEEYAEETGLFIASIDTTVKEALDRAKSDIEYIRNFKDAEEVTRDEVLELIRLGFYTKEDIEQALVDKEKMAKVELTLRYLDNAGSTEDNKAYAQYIDCVNTMGYDKAYEALKDYLDLGYNQLILDSSNLSIPVQATTLVYNTSTEFIETADETEPVYILVK